MLPGVVKTTIYRSQWRNLKFDRNQPKMVEPIITQLCMGNYVAEAHVRATFDYDQLIDSVRCE